MGRRVAACGVGLALAVLAACGGSQDGSPPALPGPTSAGSPSAPPTTPVAPATASPAPTSAAATPITLAFAGDVNTVGNAGVAVRAGLPGVRDLLSRADLTVVNLETAITDRGTPADKAFTFRGPVSTLTSLRGAGVDLVTAANNHAMDYGVVGLQDTLAAGTATGMPMVGLGLDESQAYAPYVVTVKGQRIAVIGATQVLDATLQTAWTAGPGKPGLASAKRVDRLVQEVTSARARADTVVVFLHWGQETNSCPLGTQQDLAAALVGAGASVVVGSHAHVILGGGYLKGAYVDYGLGNFAFNAHSPEGRRTGVLTVTVQGPTVVGAVWTPALITGGTPNVLTGPAATAALADKERRRGCTNLTATPTA